jgi:predicted metal-dependent hydrolase
MKDGLQFGSKRIEFHLSYSDRKTLGIKVTPDLSVTVTAPVGTSLEKVKEKLRKRAPWIIKQQGYFLTFQPKTPPRKYVSGETHLYLGRQYRLKIIADNEESVKLKGQFLEVVTTDKTKIRNLVINWYHNHAKEKFDAIAQPLIEKFRKYDVEPTSLILRNMPSRWGSCTPKGKIILNPELIKAPKACIEYVIIHELCHLVYRDHTKKFLELQNREMPDWARWKLKLEKLLA